MKKRGNNEGSFYQRPNGSWCGQVMIKGHRHTVYGKTKTEAKDRLREKIQEVKPTTSTPFLMYARLYIENKYKSKQIKLSTYDTYMVKYKAMKDYFEGIQIDKIRDSTISDFITTLWSKNYSYGTVKGIVAILLSILRKAQKDKLTTELFSIDDFIFKQKPMNKELNYDIDEVKNALESIPNKTMQVSALLILHSGIRRGELTGLKWNDIDLENGIIQINRNTYINKDGFHDTTPKSNRIGEYVQLPDNFVKVLKDYKGSIEYNDDNDYFFINQNGKRYTPISLYFAIKKAFNKHGIENGGVHILRHIYASILMNENVDILTIKNQLRHSSIATTDRYLHQLKKDYRPNIKSLKI